MNLRQAADFGHREPELFGSALHGGDDFLLVHAGEHISNHATSKQQSCKYDAISVRANADGMDGIQADTALLQDLAAYAQMKPTGLAREIGVAVTTITRPFNGTATTRLSQPTLEKLRERWPDFPGWKRPLEVVPPTNAIPKKLEGAPDIVLPRDLPVFGTSLGAPRDFNGIAIEQIMLNSGNVIDHIQRPAILHGKDYAYALYVQGSSMDPRFEDGDTIYVTDSRRAKPPRIGEDVVVYIRDLDEDDGATATGVLVKRLVRRTAQYVELQQFTPAETFRIPADMVLRMDRVLPWREIVA